MGSDTKKQTSKHTTQAIIMNKCIKVNKTGTAASSKLQCQFSSLSLHQAKRNRTKIQTQTESKEKRLINYAFEQAE